SSLANCLTIIGGLIRIIFCGGAATSAWAAALSAGGFASALGSGVLTGVGDSSVADSGLGKIFEIGGSIAAVFFIWPSLDSLCAFALSMSETEGPAFASPGFTGVFGAASRSAFVACAIDGCAAFFCASASLGAGFSFETAGFCATVGFAALGTAGL